MATGSGCARFRLEDCADDVAALAGVLGIGRFAAVGYSMGGIVAQLVYRRHASLLSGLVLCSTASSVRGSPAEHLAALAAPTVAAALAWNSLVHLMSAEAAGVALLGRIDDPAIASWARTQLRRTLLAAVVSAMPAVCGFTSESWLSQVAVPAAVVVTTRDRVVPPRRQLQLARAHRSTRCTPITGPASARRSCSPARCWRHAYRSSLAAAARCARQPDAAGPRRAP